MFLNIFDTIEKLFSDDNLLESTGNLPTLSPSSQVCYSAQDPGVQLGSCLRQVWFDKNNYTKTRAIKPHVRMAGYIGERWEEWLESFLKESGLFVQSQVPAVDSSQFVKGIVDSVVINPLTNKKELVELKTYDGSSYISMQTICGTVKTQPKPRMTHLLQAFRYLLIYKDQVDAINILYVDRSCSGWYKNKQFRVTLYNFDGKVYPSVQYDWNGSLYTHIEKNVTEDAIYNTEKTLQSYLLSGEIPPCDFKETYTSEEVEYNYSKGLIYKTQYEKYKKDPSESLGDFQCNLCSYSGGTCARY